MKVRLSLSRVRHSFHMFSDNSNVSFGSVDCSLCTRRIALKDDYHKKKMDVLAYIPVEYNYLETLAKTFVMLARQTSLFKKAFATRLQFVESLIQ